MVAAERLAGKRAVVADADGILGIEICNATILDKDAGHAIAGGGDQEGVIETEVEGPGLDFAVPIRMAGSQAEMPFADCRRRVAAALQHGRDGGSARFDDERRVAGEVAGPLLCARRSCR